MKLKELIENSHINIDIKKILYDEPMTMYTTFKIGGNAECLIKIENISDLKEVLQFANKNKINITVLGNGSNVLVLDGGIKGITLIIKLQDLNIETNKDKVLVTLGSGCKLTQIAQKFLKQEISGFEELSGIPGTIGGAITMNAGAHGKEMKDIVKEVICLDYNGNEKIFSNEEIEFSYRNSIFKREKYIIVQATLLLQKGNIGEIKSKMLEYSKFRKERQPIEFPSAGSTFKRGEDFITAKLIDEAGLKGYKIGSAEISTKHAGFIINTGNAKAKDILKLVKYVKEEVYNKFEKKIELEIEIVGQEN